MDYSKTVNLLKTDFPMKADLPQREPLLLEKWNATHLYEMMIQHHQGKPIFLLHDGPPYANGDIHIGHALNKILKDFVVKYKSLSGFQCPFKPGWDCHGLPIEHQLFKEIKKSKNDVNRNEFRILATRYASNFVDKQKKDFIRLGVLGEWGNPYLTLNKDYEASTVEIFFELRQKGFIYRKLKPGYWCAYDETALAEAEVEYADKQSDSIFVQFPILYETVPQKLRAVLSKKSSVLIWTTTPWTLPANVGLAFHPNEKYVVITVDGHEYVVADKLKDTVTKKIKAESKVSQKSFFGKDVLGLEATHPLHKRKSKVVTAEYVSMEEGTGIVHIAPGHGLEDFEVGTKWKLDVICPVDEKGQFDKSVGVPELVGKHVLKDANKAVLEALGSSLVFHETTHHSYPHCWRCKNPIMFRATEQWFLRVDDQLRRQLLHEIEAAKWEPSYGIHRIKGMVEQRPDWSLSRQRHWGTPIAVLYCKNCDEPLLDSKLDARIVSHIQQKGGEWWYETPEKEIVESLGLACPKCKESDFRKEMDILDVWFDSGISWHAVVEKSFSHPKPLAVMYLEGSDQHRGWFQTSLIPSVALRQRAPYDVVLTHGFVVDGKGRKMSKSLGNVMAPQEIIQQYGADVLRLWVAMSDYREDVRLSQDILKHVIDVYRRFRNIFRFLLQNTSDFSYTSARVPFEKMEEVDRWILVHFEEIKERIMEAYEKYEFHVVISELNRFAAVSLSGFYLDALKDCLYCEALDSPRRRSAQTALFHLARGLFMMLGPLLSFTAEEAYAELRKASHPDLPASVFLDEIASLENIIWDKDLNDKWLRILEIRGLVNDALDPERKAGLVKSSQEVKLTLNSKKLNESQRKILETQNEDWPFILQMSEVKLDGQSDSNAVQIQVTKNLKCERCWRHRPEVGQDKTHPTLCARCTEVVRNMHINVL